MVHKDLSTLVTLLAHFNFQLHLVDMGITMEEQLDMVESLIMEEVMDQEQVMHMEERDNSEIVVDLRHIVDMDSCQNMEEMMMI
ncbi:hypothetical protein ACLB2K_038304 [Fragaria x ananassa]